MKDSPDFVPGRRYVRVFEISPETADPIVTWPFESGSGSHYTATFEHLLRTYQPPPVMAC